MRAILIDHRVGTFTGRGRRYVRR